jgi:hypothetical protein
LLSVLRRMQCFAKSGRYESVDRCPGIRWGVAKLVKAPDFDSGMRGFESFLPSPIFCPD